LRSRSGGLVLSSDKLHRSAGVASHHPRASVRECLETWRLQSEAGPVTVEALETILARATVPILRQMEHRPPELVVALLPSLVRTMLAAFVEVMREEKRATQ
jgi:hypothetical protein